MFTSTPVPRESTNPVPAKSAARIVAIGKAGQLLGHAAAKAGQVGRNVYIVQSWALLHERGDKFAASEVSKEASFLIARVS